MHRASYALRSDKLKHIQGLVLTHNLNPSPDAPKH